MKSVNNKRVFSIGEQVFYKPFYDCNKSDISGPGKIIEVLDDSFYMVTFGYESMYCTRTGKYHWSKLYRNK